MKPDPIKKLKQRLAEAQASYVAVHAGDIVAACDKCRTLDTIVGALWKGSHGQKDSQVVCIKKSDLEHLLSLVEKSHGPAQSGSDVPGAEVQGERVADHHVPPKRRKRGDLSHSGPDDAPTPTG